MFYANELSCMRQRTVLITGGNDGIGRATAQVLLERGFRVVIAGRSVEKLRAAVAMLQHRTGQDTVEYLLCDLSSNKSVHQAADEFGQRFSQLDILINNAGVFTNELRYSADGFELQFAVNYLGHFLLTQRLLPRLQAAPAARIINVSSVAHYHGTIDFDNLCGEQGPAAYDGLQAYAQSKLANVLFTRELARRYPRIESNCLHPGVVRTRIANKNTHWYFSLLWTLYKPFMRPTRCGASTPVYLALSPEVKGVAGRYFDELQCCRKPSELARDPELARELWEVSEQLVDMV
ncbi:MAG: short-chain dehydrogenase [Bacteroidetes bacterium]|nr:MAG: short-chain dehydrogenase [Bacteroidota bacterium]PTM10183.1 MAG: short-chain dehydrogenase [Bacteroidota bacterium]